MTSDKRGATVEITGVKDCTHGINNERVLSWLIYEGDNL